MAATFHRPVQGDITFYPREPDYWVRTEGSVRRDLTRRMVRVKYESRRRVRVRTGRLFSTIRMVDGESKRGLYTDVVAGQKGRGGTRYLMVEHDGSRPHVIRPKVRKRGRSRRVLRFVVGGRVVFRASVNHPGTTGSKFLTASLPVAAQ